jgi:tetratricopeptide (TPR) repeat protein
MKAGHFAAAEDDARAAHDLARAAGHLEVQLRAASTQAAIHSEAGDVAGSIALTEECVAMARRLGDRRREGIALANLGEAWVELGEARRAHEHFLAALQIFVDIGDRACEGDCRVNVGRALLALGRVDDAVAMLGRAAELCAATSRVEYQGIALMLRGEAREGQAELAEARADLGRAVELFERIHHHLRWRAELALARVLGALGEAGRAHVHATRAHEQLAMHRRRLAGGTDPKAIDGALAEAAALLATL